MWMFYETLNVALVRNVPYAPHPMNITLKTENFLHDATTSQTAGCTINMVILLSLKMLPANLELQEIIRKVEEIINHKLNVFHCPTDASHSVFGN